MMSAVLGREMRYCLIIFCLVLLITPAVAGLEAPAVTGITPPAGSNATIIAITNLAGTNFTSGATVMLTPATVKPVHKGSILNGGDTLLSNPRSVYVSGDYAYVASSSSNALEIVDVTNPANPVHKGSITNGGNALLLNPMSVYVSGNYAYVASYGSNALEIVDVTNPANPVHKGSITNVGNALLLNPISVYVSGNYAYVASYGSNALEIVDVTNPAAPAHKSSISDGTNSALLNKPFSVFVSGGYAYVASSGSDALEIVDVTNPANPVHKGSISDGTNGALLNEPWSVYVSGDYAYVACPGSNALEIVDVTNPANPVHKSRFSQMMRPQSIVVSGNYAYVAEGVSIHELAIIDVTNPSAPVLKGSIANGGNAQLFNPVSVYVSGNYAYVASFGSNALEIVDIGTVTATGINVVSANQITGSFNLITKPAGSYNVVVTNPDGKFGTLSSGFTIIAANAPVANFISNVTSGTSPLTVQFTDTSTKLPTSWNWSFGDGSYSTLQNPVHIYSQGGVYTVSLNVTNAKGTDTLTRRDYIGVIFTLNDGIAIFRPASGYWYFDNNLDAVINSSFRYGGSTDQIIQGDWRGTGRDGIAIFRPASGYWYFDYNLDGIIDNSFRYGGSTDQIIKGDWNGTGRDGIAIFRPASGYWYFDYNLDGIIDKSFRYGGSGDQIIKGDWNGTGRDGIAIFRPASGYWYFDYNLDGIVDNSFRYGGGSDQIIKGDWQGTGRDGIAIFRPASGYWYFDYNLDGIVDNSFRYGGSGDQIIKGDWQGTGRDGIAIFRPASGYWYFDNYLDGVIDKSFRYGGSTDQIIAGKWISVAPAAAFMADLQNGIAPLTVQFTDQSTGTQPFTYAWDFTDDGIVDSTIKNPNFTYAADGIYTVNLTVTNIAGSNSTVKTNYITVNPPPTITLSPTSLPAIFVNLSYTQPITASGGTAPYIFNVTNGTLPTGLSLSNGGIISGTPNATGTSAFTITASDVNNFTGTHSYSLTVTPPAIILAPTSLTSPIPVDIQYNAVITASGGTAPYTYSITSGALPTNLTLSATTGTISGTPTAVGLSAFNITATDNNTYTGTRSYSLTVTPPTITLSPTSLPAGIGSNAYSQTISASGGTAPYSYSITSGALPTNLTMSAGGTISGTPTVAGPFNFNITATDIKMFNGTRSYSLIVTPPTITLAPTSLPIIPWNISYSETITASGGMAPYTYSVTTGTLPTGLDLSPGGIISGTPTATGTSPFTITATDTNSFTGTQSYSLNVFPPTFPLSPDPGPLPDATVNAEYNQTITAYGGMAPYTYNVTSGALPNELSLSTGGIISGTPTAPGMFTFSITATDARTFTGSVGYSLTVNSSP